MNILWSREKSVNIIVLSILTALALGSVYFWMHARQSQRPNVLLIVADTLRADHLGSYGYEKNTSPHLDRFAQQAILFENTIAQGPWTKPSMGSLFTSLYPHNHGAMSRFSQTLPEEVLTLAEVLKENGYHTMAIQTNPILTRIEQQSFHFDQGFDEYEVLMLDNLKEKLTHSRGEEVVNHFLQWADQNQHQKFFAYLHFMDSHLPYRPPEKHRLLFAEPYEGSFRADEILYEDQKRILEDPLSISDADKKHIVALYDASIHYLDSQIGRLIEELSSRGLLDKTILIITSDHGEEFFEHGSFGHGQSLYNELLRVPFILWDPSMYKKGVRIRPLVRLIDIFPTLLSLLQIRPPFGILGKDITPFIMNPGVDPEWAAYAEGVSFTVEVPGKTAKNFISIQKGEYKLIRETIHGKKELQFYDINRDAGETTLLNKHHALIDSYEGLLKQHQYTGKTLLQPELKKSEEKEIMERLKSLGYLH